MEIYLLQHGDSLSKEEDPEESLSPLGEEAIHRMGRFLYALGLTFDQILCSPKKRSQASARIIAEEVGFPSDEIEEEVGVKPMAAPDELLSLMRGERLLVAGHLPSLGRVAAKLLGTAEPPVAFERGGCCRIDVDSVESTTGQVRWLLLPGQLAVIHQLIPQPTSARVAI